MPWFGMEGGLSIPSPMKLHPFGSSPHHHPRHQAHAASSDEDIKHALHASSILSLEESSYSQSPLAEQAVPFNLLGKLTKACGCGKRCGLEYGSQYDAMCSLTPEFT